MMNQNINYKIMEDKLYELKVIEIIYFSKVSRCKVISYKVKS